MATVEQCDAALHELAARLEAKDPADRQSGFDRSLTCRLRDLDVVFGGRLKNGLLGSIAQVQRTDAQIRLDMTSDDLLSMCDGSLNVGAAWATGRVKVGAGVRDLLKLRSLF